MIEMRREASEDTGGPIFQPDTVLPSQFFNTLREKGFVEGEKRLMAAILADAVDVYMKQANSLETRGRNLFHDAEAWIFEEEPGRWLFSFNNICDVLGLEPEYIRRGLAEWRRRRAATIHPAQAFRRGPRTSRGGEGRQLDKAAG